MILRYGEKRDGGGSNEVRGGEQWGAGEGRGKESPPTRLYPIFPQRSSIFHPLSQQMRNYHPFSPWLYKFNLVLFNELVTGCLSLVIRVVFFVEWRDSGACGRKIWKLENIKVAHQRKSWCCEESEGKLTNSFWDHRQNHTPSSIWSRNQVGRVVWGKIDGNLRFEANRHLFVCCLKFLSQPGDLL